MAAGPAKFIRAAGLSRAIRFASSMHKLRYNCVCLLRTLQKAIDAREKTTKLDGVERDAILVFLTLPFAFGLWLATWRKWTFLASVAVASILWTVLFVVHELTFASTSLVLTIWGSSPDGGRLRSLPRFSFGFYPPFQKPRV